MKKIISAILAGACAVSVLSFSVSATNKGVTTVGEVKLSTSAALATPTIDVSVPSNLAAVVNPYGVSVNVKGVDYGKTGIASPIYTIISKTTTSKIKVSASASLTVPTVTDSATREKTATITVVDAETNAKGDDTKKLFAYVIAKAGTTAVDIVQLDAARVDDATNADKANADAKGNILLDKITPVLKEADIKWATTGCVKFVDATVTTAQPTAPTVPYTDLVTLTQPTEGKFTYAQFAIGGTITDGNNWTANDKINLNLVLKLTPCA